MILRKRSIKTKPKEGDRKIEIHFAWLPRWVGEQLVWMQSYQKIYEYTVRERVHVFYGYGIIWVTGGGWDLIKTKVN